MDNNLSFHKSIRKSDKPLTNDTSWDKVIDLHKQKDYKKAVLGILDYVDLDLISKRGNPERTEFVIPHGSAELHIKITDTDLIVHAPFLNINNGKKIPLMRKVTELNFSPLNLSAIRLKSDELAFHYECPLELCEPYKTYDALREICIYADSYDDEFIAKFDAKWIHEPKIVQYSTEQKQYAWDNMQVYIKEAKSAISYFENKRSLNFAWDILAITLMKLEYYIQPQGLLRIELEKKIGYLTSSQDAIDTKINRGKNYLDKLSNYDRAEFETNLYSTEVFIPYKIRSNQQAIKTHSENAYAQAKKEREQGNHLAATFTLVYQFFHLFYHNNVPVGIMETMEDGLEKSSGKSWLDASNTLFKTLEVVMQGKQVSSPEKKKGLFSKLFGK